MTKWEDDIRRYHSGEMSPQDQHALEKKALSDPFLAEALEGSALISPTEFSEDMKEIASKIETKTLELKKDDLRVAASAIATEESTRNNPSGPIAENKTPGRWMWPLRIAASVALVALVYFAITPLFENEKQLAFQTKAEEKSQEKDLNTDTVLNQPVEPTVMTESKADDQRSKSGKTAESIKPVEELSPPTGAAVPALADRGEQEKAKVAEDEMADVIAESQIVAEEKTESKKEMAQAAGAKRSAVSLASDQKIIQGKVLSAEDSTPLPGVNIVVKGTTAGTVTDMQGNYRLTIDSPNPTLVYSFIGMQTQEVKAKDKSDVTVKLQSDVSQLSEVVVTGYSPMKDDANNEPIVKLAEPVGGRRAYDKYLKNNLHYPQQALDNQVKGLVTIQFTVRKDGSLDEFNVLKGLGYGCDEEVIRLVKEGPTWSPTTEDDVAVESEVRVRVKFALPD